ncbi:cell adhesion molecule CEACAM8-like [Paramormyrops kingsleyae]|uniref:cell adhesion molecule CEACAM8-like n=1 Tax=Paramormyrops kingsleyae TaxID=1676925 RepID=UPI003B97AB64
MMERITFTAFFLSLFAACRSLQVTIALKPDVGTVGDSVQFLVSTDPHNGFLFISWTVNGSTILTFDGTNIITAPVYNERINFDITTGSLELKNLTLHDSGTYQLQIVASGEPQVQEVILNVLEPVSDVIIQANATELVEFNDSVSLTCSASGSSPTFHWLNGSSDIIVSERVHLTADNRTLTISSVLRFDREPIYCSVTNIVSNTRQAISININFGPDTVAVTVSPPGPIFTSGTSLTLSCSAESRPPAQFQWALNDTLLNEMGDQLLLTNIKESQSGNYVCWAHNTITQRYHSSERSVITVLEGGVHNGLSGGAIAGIVIGILLALGLFPAGFFIMKKLRSRTFPVPQNCKGSTDCKYGSVCIC